MQRDFERTRHLEQIDLRARDVARLDLIKEGDPAFLHHLAMPGRLHESDPLRFCKSRVRRNGGRPIVSEDSFISGESFTSERLVSGVLATSDSWLSSFRTRIRAYGTTRRAQCGCRDRSLSSGL